MYDITYFEMQFEYLKTYRNLSQSSAALWSYSRINLCAVGAGLIGQNWLWCYKALLIMLEASVALL